MDRFWSKLEFWQQAAWLVARWPQMQEFAEGSPLGTCGKLQQRGRIVLL
jgi:hypothetical protein